MVRERSRGGRLAGKPPACLNAAHSNYPRLLSLYEPAKLHIAGGARGVWAVCEQTRPPASRADFARFEDNHFYLYDIIEYVSKMRGGCVLYIRDNL